MTPPPYSGWARDFLHAARGFETHTCHDSWVYILELSLYFLWLDSPGVKQLEVKAESRYRTGSAASLITGSLTVRFGLLRSDLPVAVWLIYAVDRERLIPSKGC
jgi:hypothetical protein